MHFSLSSRSRSTLAQLVGAKTFLLIILCIGIIPAWAEMSPPLRKPVVRISKAERAVLLRLVAAYPDFLARIKDGVLVWRDGTRMPVDDAIAGKTFKQQLENPDILDMLSQSYRVGPLTKPPKLNFDPGRIRVSRFFAKMYGDCRKGEVSRYLEDVVWLSAHKGRHLKVTTRNGVAAKLRAISQELDALPDKFIAFLKPPGGTFNCRTIAGTTRLSTHSYGIAIDIAVKRSHYWRWSKQDPSGAIVYHNQIPMEIVAIFEKHGFIWGGKWFHYDTMHFEYRPEMISSQP